MYFSKDEMVDMIFELALRFCFWVFGTIRHKISIKHKKYDVYDIKSGKWDGDSANLKHTEVHIFTENLEH